MSDTLDVLVLDVTHVLTMPDVASASFSDTLVIDITKDLTFPALGPSPPGPGPGPGPRFSSPFALADLFISQRRQSMIASSNVTIDMMTKLAASTLTMNTTGGIRVDLLSAPFTPSANFTVGNGTLATFDGYAPVVAPSPPQQSVDPSTGNLIISLVPPVGGFYWETTGSNNLPQTIHGFVASTNTGLTPIGCQLLDAPIILTGSAQAVVVGAAKLTLRSSALS